jgi:cell division protease FtsH
VPGVAEPQALSIGGAGGLTESDLGEMHAETRAHMEKSLVVLLDGRAAEQLLFGEVTAGSGGREASDLGRATRQAMRLETDHGFGSLGLVCLAGKLDSRDLLLFDRLRASVGATIDRAYARALEVLFQNRNALDRLSAALFSAGYLEHTEIQAVLAETPLHAQEATDSPAPQNVQQSETALRESTLVSRIHRL